VSALRLAFSRSRMWALYASASSYLQRLESRLLRNFFSVRVERLHAQVEILKSRGYGRFIQRFLGSQTPDMSLTSGVRDFPLLASCVSALVSGVRDPKVSSPRAETDEVRRGKSRTPDMRLMSGVCIERGTPLLKETRRLVSSLGYGPVIECSLGSRTPDMRFLERGTPPLGETRRFV